VTAPRLVLITPNFENNSLGRTWVLWSLARALGWSATVVGVKGATVWGPLAGSDFAADCAPVTDAGSARRAVEDAVGRADLVVAVKPLPTSFGVALETTGHSGVPLLLDVDDPDIEVRTTWRPLRERLRHPLPPARRRDLLRLGELARRTPVIVSNPVLQRMYGGTVVPHARVPSASPAYSATRMPVVRFVGSVRPHKGVEVLRRAVAAEAAREPLRLEVTAAAPADAAPWERWLGTTSIAEGAALVEGADVIGVPSLPTAWSPAQLPAKLIDAMAAGRAIVASDTEPVAWALGGTGVLVPAGDVDALAEALHHLRMPAVREALGEAAHARVTEMFSIDAVAPAFERAVLGAMRSAAVG
jgi:glycosyltransferase involved in cell wall biosynthesis